MDPGVARRYARALLNAAQSLNSVPEVEDDLEVIRGLLESREDLRRALESPEVARERKLQLVDRLFADRARPLTLRLLRMLIEKRRENLISLIYVEYVRLRQDAEGVLPVVIRSAVALTDDEVKEITSRLEKQTGKRILYDCFVDPSLIGGVKVRFGDSVLDGTVLGALRRLRERFFIDVLKQV
ncbi:MAG: ATP synthase F1 subunit delta [Armatimonadetes bacterium]|nr:ATP synthase F1 subunit delta [Armatimonadota bacterium]